VIGCIGYLPAVYQWANGWTSITTRTYLCALFFLLPAMYYGYSRCGTAGAIIGWGIVRVAQSVVQIEFMHARLFADERWVWYRDSVLRPAGVALVIGSGWRLLATQTRHVDFVLLALVWITCVAGAVLCSPLISRIPRLWPVSSSSAS